MADEKKREKTALGYDVPTKEEAEWELSRLMQILDIDGCASIRDLISSAGLVVDIAHLSAHAPSTEAINKAITEEASPLLGSALKKMEKIEFETAEELGKWYGRMTAILLAQARIFAAMAYKIEMQKNKGVESITSKPPNEYIN
jgi:hypothetical protein